MAKASTPESVIFASDGGECQGWLYRPEATDQEPIAIIVLAHGFSGTHLTQYARRAERLAESGAAVLDFDPRHIGASPGEPRQRIDLSDWVVDLRAAVEFARTLPGIDPGRVGLFGSSLGGGLALAVAAQDRAIAALDLVVPLVDGLLVTPRARPSDRARVLSTILGDGVGRLLGRAPRSLRVIGRAGEGALITSDDDYVRWHECLDEIDGIEWVAEREVARHPRLGEWRNQTLAWEQRKAPLFRPGRQAAKVRCPILAQIALRDQITPARSQIRMLAKAPNVEIRQLPVGHFDPFGGEWFERTVTDDIAFFSSTLSDSSQ